MQQLKSNMLREIAELVCSRNQFEQSCDSGLSVGQLVVAGKEMHNALRKIVESDVLITHVSSTDVQFKFRGFFWEIEPLYLNKLFVKWARKLHVYTFEAWLYDSPRRGFVNAMCENEDIEELSIGQYSVNNWPQILMTFPKLISMTMTPSQFARMLREAPKELFHLKEVRLKDDDGYIAEAFKTLLTHRTKCPSLEAIFYTNLSVKEVEIPDSDITVPTLKHLEIITNYECCAPLDFSLLATVNKIFPSLEAVIITIDSHCHEHQVRDLESLEHLYEAFHLLRFDFFVRVVYREKLHPFLENGEKLHQLLAAKGKLYGSPYSFVVETLYSNKELIHEVTISGYENEFDENTYFCNSSDEYDLSEDSDFEFSD